MFLSNKKCYLFLLFMLAEFNVSLAFSDSNYLTHIPSTLFVDKHAIVQIGGYSSIQGQAQHINIQDLIGDDFTVNHSNDSNVLIGLGYLVNAKEQAISYGINAFYLANTNVAGNVNQENLFTNLSYHYNLTHYPVYLVTKSTIKWNSSKYALTIDTGIGPNFISASGFQERSLDGVTLPDTIFSSHTSTTFSATAGLNIKINNALGSTPIEIGYRFFYLGQGHFNISNSQVLNTLKTGSNYANAILCSIMI